MFAESLVEVSPAERIRKSWLTVGSITIQAVFVAGLLLLPLVKPESLALIARIPAPISWLGSAQPIEVVHQAFSPSRGGAHPISVPHTLSFRPAPTPDGPDAPAACVTCPIAATPGPAGPGIFPLGNAHAVMPLAPAPPLLASTHAPRVSHVMEGNLILKVQPRYPAIAKTAGIQGTVELQAIVSRDGTIENLRVLSGHPLLVKAAIEAVSQWRYRPYYLNGEAIEVETQVTVNFSLNR